MHAIRKETGVGGGGGGVGGGGARGVGKFLKIIYLYIYSVLFNFFFVQSINIDSLHLLSLLSLAFPSSLDIYFF